MIGRTAASAAVVAAVLSLAACGGGGGAKSGGRTVSLTLTDAGCEPAKLSLPAGATTFEVANDGADAVSEFEVLDGDRIVGEVEDLAPGLSGRFSITLKPGRYVTYCPGGKTAEHGTLVVTGTGGSSTSAAGEDAVGRYRSYVEAQTALLVRRTQGFVGVLGSGDLPAAKERYATARVPYERIEPVAESFGGLDPAIDARAGDVPTARWTGFHPIERALWVKDGTAGTGTLAGRLLADVKRLQRRVRTVELEPAQVANGAVELLGEVSKSKITGEEERYSHIDLVDFEANVDGARAAFDSLTAILAERRPELAHRIDARFDAVDQALRPYRRGDGFVSYTELGRQDTRRLSRAIDALAEPLSQVAAIVVQ